MAVHHSFYHINISVANALRKLIGALVTTEPKDGLMWRSEWTNDSNVSEEFPTRVLGWIVAKSLKSTGGEDMFVKILFNPTEGTIKTLISSECDTAVDYSDKLVLKGSIRNANEDNNSQMSILDHSGSLVFPKDALVPTVFLPSDFNATTDLLSKVWVVRKLSPLLDQVLISKLTDIYGWMTFCTKEVPSPDALSPLEAMGYYHHMGFGMCGEQFLPDASIAGGGGLYTCATSLAAPNTLEETGKYVWSGGGEYPVKNPTNIGCVFCAGKIAQPIPDKDNPEAEPAPGLVKTWFYANHAYGLGRAPFDQEQFGFGGEEHAESDPHNVGLDYTELCKYSPYSGVRILTPAYIYGMFDSLYRILGRLPVFYTALSGLYSGDIVSQDADGVTKDYILFPFIKYKCLGDAEARRGHAIFVPQTEA